jgi:hypothetical protein
MTKKPASPLDQRLVPTELIDRRIYLIRGQKVMLDHDLAALYQVPTKALNQAVRRNADRFPDDFMFRLSSEESGTVNRSQIVTGSQRHRDPRNLPYAFTELGVAMLSSVLNSQPAIQMNIVIMRAFVRMRELVASHRALAEKTEKLELTQKQHGTILVAVVQDIQRLKTPLPTRAIGFVVRGSKKK